MNDTSRNGGPGRSLHAILKFLDPALIHRAVVLPRRGPIAALFAADQVADELHFLPGLVENPFEPWSRPIERDDLTAPHALRAVRLAGNLLRAFDGLLRLERLAHRARADLLYCNGTTADFAGGAIASWSGPPALWHVRYSSLPRALGGLHRSLSARPEVRRIVCVSAAAASLFAHCPQKVAVVHNALDLDAFRPGSAPGTLRRECDIAPDAVVFGACGRVLRRKGFVELVRAARAVVDRLRGTSAPGVAFVVVGDTPEDFFPDHLAECRRLTETLGVAAHFHFLGFRADVRPLVADFDVSVVPSVYPDPLPRAVMESMALGKPVIAFDVGGVGEMIEAGVTGELVPFERDGAGASEGAIARLAEAMVRCARDPARRSEMGTAGRLHAERDFDARAHARRIEQEILAAVAPTNGAPR